MKLDRAILCVDDDFIILLSLKQELQDSFKGKFIIETAPSAADALEIIDELFGRDVKVILIITDWLMPDMKGDELLEIVKKKHPDIKCIIISGQSDEKAIENAYNNIGLDAFISKPWSNKSFVSIVEKLVQN